MLDPFEDEDSTTELQQLHEEVVTIIDCLYQMSMLIRKPAHHDLLVGSHKNDKAGYEFWDRNHVREKYPSTEDRTVERLGRVITRRRRYLDYRIRHHAKLGQGLDETQGIQWTDSLMSGTKATDFMVQYVDSDENTSSSGVSQTSYAQSLMGGGTIIVPHPPKESASGKPFECPYCFFLITIKGMYISVGVISPTFVTDRAVEGCLGRRQGSWSHFCSRAISYDPHTSSRSGNTILTQQRC